MSKLVARIILAFLFVVVLVALAIFAPYALGVLGIFVGMGAGTFALIFLLYTAFPDDDDYWS